MQIFLDLSCGPLIYLFAESALQTADCLAFRVIVCSPVCYPLRPHTSSAFPRNWEHFDAAGNAA